MNTQDVKNLAAALDLTLMASRGDGVYDFLTFTGARRNELIDALPDDVAWERLGENGITVDVLRPFDRSMSW